MHWASRPRFPASSRGITRYSAASPHRDGSTIPCSVNRIGIREREDTIPNAKRHKYYMRYQKHPSKSATLKQLPPTIYVLIQMHPDIMLAIGVHTHPCPCNSHDNPAHDSPVSYVAAQPRYALLFAIHCSSPSALKASLRIYHDHA